MLVADTPVKCKSQLYSSLFLSIRAFILLSILIQNSSLRNRNPEARDSMLLTGLNPGSDRQHSRIGNFLPPRLSSLYPTLREPSDSDGAYSQSCVPEKHPNRSGCVSGVTREKPPGGISIEFSGFSSPLAGLVIHPAPQGEGGIFFLFL